MSVVGRRQPLAGRPPAKPVKDVAAFAAVLTSRLKKSHPKLAIDDLQAVPCEL